ncbi:F-box family protein [Rhynchospora pubera]|uniref:F-box family protein n=1 Tax=Rhynchospora pubera TaxID=906938 RepID=A0AAV8HJW3_9POAL|nr:F-box family protein [Rhynchospora pubera]
MARQRSERDWADLPADLVTTIAEKASTTNTQYIHLRFVCKAWRRALIPNPCHLPPQSPWLLLPRFKEGFDPRIRGGFDCPDELNFYDPFWSKTHRFRLPYLSGKRICGSSHGWLVLEHDPRPRVSLFNPITQSSIDLPSLDDPPTILRSAPSGRFILKATLSGNPSEDGCAVVAWFSQYTNWELGFCRIGDTHWTDLLMGHERQYLLDFACYKNLVYTVNLQKDVSVYDLHDLSESTFPSKIKYDRSYDQINLVDGDSESAEPLIVRTTKYSTVNRISVYKWFNDMQQWHQVENIGKQVLFLDSKHCINLQLEEGRENQLYYDVRYSFSDNMHSSINGYFCVGVNVMHLKSRMPVPLQHSPTCIYLFYAFEFPMWVTPSLI